MDKTFSPIWLLERAKAAREDADRFALDTANGHGLAALRRKDARTLEAWARAALAA